MSTTLYSHSLYQEIITHTTLSMMTKLTDYTAINGTTLTAKEQDEALRRAWISNTEVKLLERKSK
tara:strand:+ start:781 stop:975 length:195 start_codon:yes stop_codon:yes gene_type:complete